MLRANKSQTKYLAMNRFHHQATETPTSCNCPEVLIAAL
jgi:hypothetical protein